MSNENGAKPLNVLLSREELLLVLQMLRVSALPGLDDDPNGALSAEQQATALTVAARALRARELAQVRDNGELAIHTALLAAVGVCAYPQQTIYVYHWPTNGAAARRYFGYVRGEEIVAHTRPADVLHLFARLPSPPYFVGQLLSACAWEDGLTSAPLHFTAPVAIFAQARQQADNGAPQAAANLLVQHRASVESARAFATTLADRPRLSIVQMRKQHNGAVAARDLTLVQNSQRSWLITNDGEGEKASVQVKSTTTAEVSALLAGWLN
ncbi:MAG: hypothetical protein R3C14_23595 [Caldilineaceae bacterium]